jgi:putative ATPase
MISVPDDRSPLAHLLRPQSLSDIVGQEHLVGPGKPLSQLIEQHQVFSMVFWGPPGVGKTTLARILAKESNRDFFELSAVAASKADVKNVLDQASSPQRGLGQTYRAPVLFLDEIHRFNKAQQDFLLPAVEKGTIVLIGATTENPSFEVISPLLSRLRVFVLEELSLENLRELVTKAAKSLKTAIDEKATDEAIRMANGDARAVLTLLDNCWQTYGEVTLDHLKNIGDQFLRYDKQGEQHYDTISALIKSLRASNIDAALYYLARLVQGGEDPKFIARRLVIFASEDVGLAQPTALVVANAVFEAVTKVGYPEAQINLAHGVSYLAQAQKNRDAYNAYFAALKDVEQTGNLPIPKNLRNAPTKLMKELGYGEGYEMYSDKSLLPKKLGNKKYFHKTS